MRVALVRCQPARRASYLCPMPVHFLACDLLLGQIGTMAFLEIAIEGLRIAQRHEAGARRLTELLGIRGFDGTELVDARTERRRHVSVRIDLWIVELIEELVESRRPARVRAFIRDAVLAYVDLMAEGRDPPEQPLVATRTAS